MDIANQCIHSSTRAAQSNTSPTNSSRFQISYRTTLGSSPALSLHVNAARRSKSNRHCLIPQPRISRCCYIYVRHRSVVFQIQSIQFFLRPPLLTRTVLPVTASGVTMRRASCAGSRVLEFLTQFSLQNPNCAYAPGRRSLIRRTQPTENSCSCSYQFDSRIRTRTRVCRGWSTRTPVRTRPEFAEVDAERKRKRKRKREIDTRIRKRYPGGVLLLQLEL